MILDIIDIIIHFKPRKINDNNYLICLSINIDIQIIILCFRLVLLFCGHALSATFFISLYRALSLFIVLFL